LNIEVIVNWNSFKENIVNWFKFHLFKKFWVLLKCNLYSKNSIFSIFDDNFQYYYRIL
jgi:hypothetical protein